MEQEVKMVKASEFFNDKTYTEREPSGWEVKKDEDGVYKFYHKDADLYLEADDINRYYDIEIIDIGEVNDDKASAMVELQSEEWICVNLDRVGNVKFAQISNEATIKRMLDENV